MGIPSNNTTMGYASTLLIPEKTAWLPYVGLVVTVAVWLGYDLYRFHRKNIQKYSRLQEHMTILREIPSRQRISMVSGIGLRFRRGKPYLGDVWNTSPSSSDMSSCCAPRRHATVSYSREVTPSDEGGEYSETDLFGGSKSGSCADLVGNEVHNTHHKGWEIGGEFVKGVHQDTEKDVYIVDPTTKDGDSPIFVVPLSNTIFQYEDTAPTTTRPYNDGRRHPAGKPAACVGGGVDDGGGGTRKVYKDVATQTTFNDFILSVTPEEEDGGLHLDHAFHYPGHSLYSSGASPRLYRNTDESETGSSLGHSGSAQDHSGPDFFSPRPSIDARSVDTSSKCGSGKSEKRHPPPLRLDLLSAPYSPTSEIVATKHGFAVEGLEVPPFTNSGTRSLPSSESEVFKPPDTQGQGQSPIKTFSPSPVVSARISSSSMRPLSPRHNIVHPSSPHPPLHHHSSSYHHSSPHHHSLSHHHSSTHNASSSHTASWSNQHHHHRSKRHDSFGLNNPGNMPSKPVSLSKKNSQTLPQTSRQPRAVSSSPRIMKEYETSDSAINLKMLKDSSREPPSSAPIPTHLYHQDEEGFFSSINSSSHSRRAFNREADDYTNKGILFFSRLAGIGRNQDQGVMGRQNYKSGGFES